MKELSLHILDIAQNSISAGCTRLELSLTEQDGQLTLVIGDNGRGMTPEFLSSVTDPFTTTRTTRKVGLGLPLLRMAAEQTGGSLAIESTVGVGTTVTVRFCSGHIDCPPLGDMAGTVALLVQGAPEVGDSEEVYLHHRHPYTEALLSSVPVPDPDVARNNHPIILQGEIPSPIAPHSGCRFRTRCPYATQLCAEKEPPLVPVRSNHAVACHRVTPA